MKQIELELRRELWWVYLNILKGYGKWDKELIEKRLDELRFYKNKGAKKCQ